MEKAKKKKKKNNRYQYRGLEFSIANYYLIQLVLKSQPDSAVEATSRKNCCFAEILEILEADSLSCEIKTS
jgi:hypothetical protein